MLSFESGWRLLSACAPGEPLQGRRVPRDAGREEEAAAAGGTLPCAERAWGTWGRSPRARLFLVEGLPSDIRKCASSGAEEPPSPRLHPGQPLALEEHSRSHSVGGPRGWTLCPDQLPCIRASGRRERSPGSLACGPPRQPHPPMRPRGRAAPPTRFTRRHLSHCHGAANYSHICLQLDKTGLEVKCRPQPLPLAHSVPRAGTLHIRPRCVGGRAEKAFGDAQAVRGVDREQSRGPVLLGGRAGQTPSLPPSVGFAGSPPRACGLQPCLPRTVLSQRCSRPKFSSVLKGFMLICFLAKNVSTLGVVFK